MSTEGDFEKTRIQNQDEAHEEANMLTFALEGGEKPTAKDYDEALRQLEILEEETNEGTAESMDKAMHVFVSGTSVALDRIPKLLVAAALNVFPYPENVKESVRKDFGGGVIEQLKNIPKDYKERRALFQTAREELERWKTEAETFASKQETAEEFNKRQAEGN
ncbi:MAG: hypothetical protein B7X03_02255 [Parcubacteria group bacterium 21-58-10]|nr:MAG: hypothetical protein B7X03_02255 [Parcubacteria group bacterium 21-58-10]